jgi:hypothetical protein
MQDDDTLMDAYIQTVQHTTISLMIQHCINHAILESDRGIIDPDDAMMLRYADIQ